MYPLKVVYGTQLFESSPPICQFSNWESIPDAWLPFCYKSLTLFILGPFCQIPFHLILLYFYRLILYCYFYHRFRFFVPHALLIQNTTAGYSGS